MKSETYQKFFLCNCPSITLIEVIVYEMSAGSVQKVLVLLEIVDRRSSYMVLDVIFILDGIGLIFPSGSALTPEHACSKFST
jgi:hypothetical protein